MAKWLVQTITCGAATLIVACASIAGIGDSVDDPADASTEPSSTSKSSSSGASSTSSGTSSTSSGVSTSSSSGASSSTSSSGASTSSGAPVDGGGADANLPIVDSGVAGCTKKQNNDSCNQEDDCCSNHCKQNFKCDSSCSNENDHCDFGSTDNCCRGFYCAGTIGMSCVKCIDSGNPAARLGQFANPYSCCSQTANIAGICQ